MFAAVQVARGSEIAWTGKLVIGVTEMRDETEDEQFDEAAALLNARRADYGDESAIESNKKLIAKYVMQATQAGASGKTLEAARALLLSKGSYQDVKAALDLLHDGNVLNLNSSAMRAEVPAAAPKTWIQ